MTSSSDISVLAPKLNAIPSGGLSPAKLVMILIVLIGLVAVTSYLPSYPVRIINSVLIYVLLGIGLNIVLGYAGLLDLGFIAFYAIGAYAYALLASDQLGIHLGFGLTLMIGALAAGLVGLLLGLPVLRLRGDYLAIVTLGFGEIIRILFNNLDAVTNGPQGIFAIDAPEIFGFPLTRPLHFFYLLMAVDLVFILLVWRMENSMLGLAWRAVREDQDAARGVGVNTTLVKLAAFGLSASIGGVAGVIFAGMQRFVSPESFGFWESLTIVLVIVVGGVGNILGVIAGAIVLVVLPELLREHADLRMLIYGIVLVSVILLRPDGILGQRFNLAWLLRRNAK